MIEKKRKGKVYDRLYNLQKEKNNKAVSNLKEDILDQMETLKGPQKATNLSTLADQGDLDRTPISDMILISKRSAIKAPHFTKSKVQRDHDKSLYSNNVPTSKSKLKKQPKQAKKAIKKKPRELSTNDKLLLRRFNHEFQEVLEAMFEEGKVPELITEEHLQQLMRGTGFILLIRNHEVIKKDLEIKS